MVDTEAVKNSIENNTYYEEARSWYADIYMALISERVFYILLTSLAFVTLILSLISFFGLLPITSTVPFLYQSRNVHETVPRLEKLSNSPTEDSNIALRRLFVNNYLKYRENYSRNTIALNDRFILNHTSLEAYSVYRRYMNQSNPRSPLTLYGAKAKRDIKVTKLRITKVEGEDTQYRADVDFNSEISRFGDSQKSRWNAVLLFDYQDLKEVEKTEEEKEEDELGSELNITPMVFKVLHYEARPY